MVAHRTPLVSVQCVRRLVPMSRSHRPDPNWEYLINVEVNSVPAFTLGPYNHEVTLPDALALVAADIRLGDNMKDYRYAAAQIQAP